MARTKTKVSAGTPTCDWIEERDGEYWDTKCGEAHCFTEGGPRENHYQFCPYCGGKLIARAAGRHP